MERGTCKRERERLREEGGGGRERERGGGGVMIREYQKYKGEKPNSSSNIFHLITVQWRIR